MQQKDLILRQIEMISIILLRLTKQLESAQNFEDISVDFESLKAQHNIDIKELISIPKSELKSYLVEKNVLTDSFIDLAKYTKALSLFFEKTDAALSNTYLLSSKNLMELYEEETGTAFLSL